MDKTRIATAAGAVATALAMLPLDAGAASPPSGLFQPIPNATAGDSKPIQARWHRHRWHRYYGYRHYGYGYRRPYWWRHHHHHYRYYYDRRWY